MTSERQLFPLPGVSSFTPLDADERRAQMTLAEQSLLAERQRRLGELSSMDKTPEERIQLWEKLHALSLPRRRDHKLVRVIARQTALSVDQIHQEQVRRVPSS